MAGARDTQNPSGGFDTLTTIRAKLTLVIMGVSATALLLAGVLIVSTQMAAYRKKMAGDLLVQARVLASNSQAAVSFDDDNDAKLVLESLSGQASLAFASITKMDGKLLADYRRGDYHETPLPFVAGESGYDYQGGWLLARVPVLLEGVPIGYLFLQYDLRDFRVFRNDVVLTVGGSLLLVVLVTLLIAFKLRAVISVPIEQLTETVRTVASSRDYSIRAARTGGDEIGVLAHAFNDMLTQVELRDAKLIEREQRTQEYLHVAGVMIVALDAQGLVTLVNPRGCEILGRKEVDIIGKNWIWYFVPERSREDVVQQFDAWQTVSDATVQHSESYILSANGQERLIAWNVSVIRGAEGQVLSILMSGEDITESREAEAREAFLRDQLARAERMKSIGVLAGGVAHDLNNILGPLVALPEFVKEDLPIAVKGDPAALAGIEHSLGIMEDSALRAANVVQDLLAISRRGNYKRVTKDVNRFHCFVKDSATLHGLRHAYPGVRFELDLCDKPLTVLASEDHLCRVIDNLMRNAADAIEGDGVVRVATAQVALTHVYNGFQSVPPGNYAAIKVSDTGCGMSPETVNRIFEPFYSKKAKTNRSGSGLGLAIVHGIVEDHDGYVDVESHPGRGTTFTLYFPLVSQEKQAGDEESRELARGTGRVLVVDDESAQRYLASSCLTRLGYTVGLAEDGRSAVRIFLEAKEHGLPSPYDLVVLDMVMEADFDGLDTLREIRGLYPEQKIVIASGHAEYDRTSAVHAFGVEWLAKPYRLNALAGTVSHLLAG
jgi:PAS domain S-box-containing protein